MLLVLRLCVCGMVGLYLFACCYAVGMVERGGSVARRLCCFVLVVLLWLIFTLWSVQVTGGRLWFLK